MLYDLYTIRVYTICNSKGLMQTIPVFSDEMRVSSVSGVQSRGRDSMSPRAPVQLIYPYIVVLPIPTAPTRDLSGLLLTLYECIRAEGSIFSNSRQS